MPTVRGRNIYPGGHMAQNGGNHPHPDPKAIRTVHVVNGEATSVSTDGDTCKLRFRDSTGELFDLTFPVNGLPRIRAMLADLMRGVARHNLGDLGVPIRYIKSILVNRQDGARNHVLMVVDANLPEETAFALPDLVAHEVAAEMAKLAVQGMTPEQRAKLGILASAPSRSRLILPGG